MTESRPFRRSLATVPWPLFLAGRYLRSGRRDAFVRFLSAVAVGGIALGVTALILSLSALNGLQRGLRNEVLRLTPEIAIELDRDADVAAALAALRSLEGIESASRRLTGNGWVLVAGSARPVEIVGYEGELPGEFPEARQRTPGVYVSDRFARRYGFEPGEIIELASTRSTLSPLGPVPRVRRARVLDTFDHASLTPRERIALPFDLAETLVGGRSLEVIASTGDLDRSLETAERARAMLPAGSVVRTWQDLNGALLLALRLEKRLMFVAVFLIVLVGALALISDLSLIIASRRSEIGILGTIGAPARSLRDVFLILGGLLTSAGVLGGGLLGTLLARILDRWALVRLPGDVYLMDHVPFEVRAGDLLWIAGLTMAIGLACCWVGANKAARLRPVEALRS